MMEGLQQGLKCSECGHVQSTSKYLLALARQLKQWRKTLDGEPLARMLEFVERSMVSAEAKLRMSAAIQDWEPGTATHKVTLTTEELIEIIEHWRRKSKEADRIIEELEEKNKETGTCTR